MPEAGTGVLGTRIREQAKPGRRGGTRLGAEQGGAGGQHSVWGQAPSVVRSSL